MASSIGPGLATAANFLAPILEDHRASYEYYKIVTTILPKVLATVVDWSCKKDASQSYLEFLRNKCPQEKWVKYSKRWSEDETNHKLGETNCDTFDVTFLYRLIPEVCDKFDELDLVLREAKELRNENAHNPTDSTMSPEMRTKIEGIIERLLCQAGKLYKIDPQGKIDEFSVMIEEVMDSVRTEKERSMIATCKVMCKEGKKDIEDTVKKQATEKLPFSTLQISRRKVFHSPKLLIEDDQDNSNSLVISCEGLLDKFRGSCIIVTGDPGSGKSTLLRNLREDFVSTTKTEIFHGVRDYDLLLYMECRDPTTKSIPDLLIKNFPKTMALLGDDQMVIDSIRDLKLLVCVDGIDELNQITSKLLDDIVDIFVGYGPASFVFTSRPGASSILQRNLSQKGLTSVTAYIQLLNEEKEQIQFLDRYKENIPGINGDGLIKSFKTLDDSCKYNCMTHPVYLSLFCHIFHSDNQAVRNWKNEYNVMEKLLEFSKKFIMERLILECVEDYKFSLESVEDHAVTSEGIGNPGIAVDRADDAGMILELLEEPFMMEEDEDSKITVEEVDSLATNLLNALSDLTVSQLLDDELVIDQRTYRELCAYTFGKLDVNYYTVLSCVLVGQEDHMFFEYIHKINAEFLAAKAILARLKNEPEAAVIATICRVVSEYSRSLQQSKDKSRTYSSTLPVADEDETINFDPEHSFRFFTMFKFVLMGLCEAGDSDKESIRRSTIEICRVLVHESSQAEHFFEFPASCPDSLEVAEATALVVNEVMAQESSLDRKCWNVSTPRQMLGLSLILPICQPISITVDPPREWVSLEAMGALMEQIAQCHAGNLNLVFEYSYMDWTPADHLVTPLDSARCRLRQFEGCLSSKEGQQALLQAVLRPKLELDQWAEEEIPLHINLPEPREHQLAGLREADHRLDVRVQLIDGDRCLCPLPVGTKAPTLVCPHCGHDTIPTEPIPSTVICPHCERLEPCPPSLTVVCPSLGVDWKPVEELIEDLAPKDKRFQSLRIQRWQRDDTALNQLVMCLLSAGVRTYSFGAPLWEPASFDPRMRCRACRETTHSLGEGRCVELLPGTYCSVSSAEEMRAVTLVLLTLKQPSLRTSPLQAALRKNSTLIVSLPRELGTLPELLSPLLSAVAQCFKRMLHLVLEHSYWDCFPADEFLELLSSAECRLVEFRGCISRSDAASRALAALVCRKDPWDKVSLHIALNEPHAHPMTAFGPIPPNTDVRYKVHLSDDAAPQSRRPLADDSRVHTPSLTVVCTPSAQDWLLVDTLIQNLAPVSKGYHDLGLQGWTGTDESLERLVWSLRHAGLWTTAYDGETCWKQATTNIYTRRCEVCDQEKHQETHQETPADQETDRPQNGRCIRLLLPMLPLVELLGGEPSSSEDEALTRDPSSSEDEAFALVYEEFKDLFTD